MTRWMRYDASGRVELLIHVGLGLAALAAVFICLSITFNFAANLDRIADRLAFHPAPRAEVCGPDSDRNSLANGADLESRQVKSSRTPPLGLPGTEPGARCKTNLPISRSNIGDRSRGVSY